MPLDRSHLELLRALTEHATLRAAATSINLSPSAASRRLHDAERRVGVALTTADGRSLELTSAGRYLAEAARDADQLLADAEVAARWLDRTAAHPVRLGLSFHDTIGWAIDPATPAEVLRTTERGWPGALTDGALDIVIDVGDVAPGHARTPLGRDRLVAVVPPGHDLAARRTGVDGPDLSEPTYFASAVQPRPGFEFERLFRPSNSGPSDIVRVESAAYLFGLIAAGRGVSIQPRLAVGGRNDVAIVELTERIEIEWFAHLGADADPAATALAHHVADRFASALRSDTGSVPG